MHRYGRELPLFATQITHMPCTIWYIVIELRDMCMHDFAYCGCCLGDIVMDNEHHLWHSLCMYGMVVFLVFTTKLLVCLFQHDTLMGFHSFSVNRSCSSNACALGRREMWAKWVHSGSLLLPPLWKKLGLMFSLLQNHKLVNPTQTMHSVGLGFSKVST